MPDFLPFALPEIGDDEIAEVVDTLRSGWITTGPKARRFEADFAAWLAAPGGGDAPGSTVRHAVAVNSATAGLHLALEALGVGPGDEVVTTTHTFTATAEVARYLGADLRFVDCDPATLCLDARALDAAIGPRTKVVVPVHFAGLAADMPAIHAVAARRGVAVVEDAAHALPATSAGRRIGTLDGSAATVFSFYANKTITTGEGGMLVTADAKIAERARVMRLHGISRDAFERFRSTTPAWAYEIVAPGFKYNLTDLAASIGIHQLRRAEDFRRRREAIAEAYLDAFADLPLIAPARAPAGEQHAWHLFVIRLAHDAPLGRDAFIDAMHARGVGCSVHYIPLHRQPYWRERYALHEAAFPASEAAWQASVSLPIWPAMGDAAVARVIDAVRSLLR